MIVFCYFVVVLSYFTPKDPLFKDQFYLKNRGKSLAIEGEDIAVDYYWNQDVFGKGVPICIIDDGCNYEHIDLEKSYSPDMSWNYINWDNDSMPINETTDTSGTINAGIISAEGNTECIIGIAKDSSFSCFNLHESNRTHSNLVDSLTRNNDAFRIKLIGFPFKCTNKCDHEQEDSEITRALDTAPQMLNYVAPCGSDAFLGGDSNFHPITRHPRTIVVADTNHRGARSAWTNHGTSVLISAPAGGSSSLPDELFPTFPGLSSSDIEETVDASPKYRGAAVVAGGIALLLESHPNFAWRDVQAILALSATQTDPGHPSWIKNAAGIFYSRIYGFGRLNLNMAGVLSRRWDMLPPQITVEGNNTEHGYIPKNRGGGIDRLISIEKGIESIEYAILKIKLVSDDYSALRIYLTSPKGTKILVKAPSESVEKDEARECEYTVRAFLGESASGKWTIHIVSDGVGDDDAFLGAELKVYGIPSKQFHSFQSVGNEPYKPKSSEQITKLDVKADGAATCGAPVNISVSLSDGRDLPIVLYLEDENRRSRWPVINRPISSKEVNRLTLPCFYENASMLNLVAEDERDSAYGETPLMFKNSVDTNTMIKPAAYDVVRKDEDGSAVLELIPTMNLKYWIDGAFAQRARVELYDLDNNTVKFRRDISLVTNLSIRIENAPTCARCLLSFVPNWHTTDDDCLNAIQTLSLIDKFSDAPAPWVMNLSSKCPTPPGIFTPTPTPNPTPTFTAEATPTPTQSFPGENLKTNQPAIIVGSVFIGTFVLFLALFLYFQKNRKIAPGLSDERFDFSLVE